MTDSSFADEATVAHIGSPEPAFYPLAGYDLRLGRSDRAMADFLAARIESAPKDLLCHTRWIFIAMTLDDSEELFGALVDRWSTSTPRRASPPRGAAPSWPIEDRKSVV